MALPKYQQEANEKYFAKVLDLLKDNGFYMWPAEGEFFKKNNNKLSCSKKAYDKVALIVSKPFLQNHFSIQ